MLVLAKAVMAIMLGFVTTVIFGYFVVKWLRKEKLGQNVSKTLGKRHESKQGTPTMGGIMFIIPIVVITIALILTGKMQFSPNLFIVLFVFVAYAILGYIDDYLVVKKHNNKGLSIFIKLLIQLVIALVFFYIYLSSGNEPVLNIHTLGIEIPIAAVAMGASVIEKHFTLDRDLGGPDHKASLEPRELKAMIESIRHVERALGSGLKQVSYSERKNVDIARKSIVAYRSIRAGEVFTEDNITVKRPGNGISPMYWDEILGRRAQRDFLEDELIEI